MTTTRRELLGAGLGTLAIVGCRHGSAKHEKEEGEEVSPVEDLMREHGVLRRIILVYAEAARRLQANEQLAPDVLTSAAHIVRTFVEDYHEQLEEKYLFPRFEAAKVQVELVAVLRAQHAAGRVVTDRIVAGATASGLADPAIRASVVDAIYQFRRMYEPHAAREDTVLFPALVQVIGHEAYENLGETFEDEEHRRFGARGFFGIVDEVAMIEANLGIADLAQFTPKV